MMLNQIEEISKRLKQSVQSCSEVQEKLSEANNKISHACLDKAVLSTQVLKLEDNIKELKAKLIEVLSNKDHLMQEKKDLLQRVLEMQQERTTHDPHDCLHQSNNNQDKETVLIKEELTFLRQVNEKLRGELESIEQSLEISQHQLHERKEERITNAKHITDLEAKCSQLVRENDELLNKMNENGHNSPTEAKEKCCQHRESVEVLELEKQKLQDQCLYSEAQVREKENVLHLQKEEYQKQDAMRVQHIEELKAVVSHWTDKWQRAALSLQSKQDELEEFKKNINKKVCDSLLRAELDACKQELEQERSKNPTFLQRYEDKGGEMVLSQTVDRETETATSESSLICESPSDSQSHQNKSPQVLIQSHEVERLRQKLAEREKELSEKEHTLKSLEGLRQMEKTEAQIKISALELKLMKKVSEDCQNNGSLQTDFSITDSLRFQLDESTRRAEQLQQEKMLAVQRLQALRQQLSPVKDETPSVEGRKDKTLCTVNPETEQQRRMVNEQLKCLFKEREGKETGKEANAAEAAQNQTSTSLDVRGTVDRRNWQQGSGLTPVFEEDEENSDWTGEEEEDPAEETQAGS
ncbi:girdin-like [Melanotaenia boesemani]|uniref:girdin-like n=1 Tax=Melanotaenia boesemani TaxID=1250792 RepID=UPI001C0410A1|nr:girdin-like [Melanotaenia boesemani]